MKSQTISLNESLTGQNSEYQIYSERWFILLIFGLLSAFNAALWVTYAPISDLSQIYFNSSDSSISFSPTGSLTAINMLATVFQILYAPGTFLGAILMRKNDGLRLTMLVGGYLTTFGALIRLIGAIAFDNSSFGATANYSLQLLGQCFAAMAQPLYVNFVAVIASSWFPLKERDTATTLASLCNPIGSAIGNILPAVFVSSNGADSVRGITLLMAVEFGLCLSALVLAQFYFSSKPPTPPSHSTFLKEFNRNSLSSSASETKLEATSHENLGLVSWKVVFSDASQLIKDRNYMLLLISFSLSIGLFNAIVTLLNQILLPWGYSNDDAGNFGAILIVLGLIGAGVAGYFMEVTREYRKILKIGFAIVIIVLLFFFFMLKANNSLGLYFAFGLLGFFLLPLLPVGVENAAECTYPIAEELSVGFLFIGGNVVGIGLVFAIQGLLSNADNQESAPKQPMIPSNIFILVLVLIAFCQVMMFHGEYKRLKKENIEQTADI